MCQDLFDFVSHVRSDLCLSVGSLNLGFMTNILNVGNENRLSREALSKQEKGKGWSREMCQSYFTTWLNPSYFNSSSRSLLSCVFTVSTAPFHTGEQNVLHLWRLMAQTIIRDLNMPELHLLCCMYRFHRSGISIMLVPFKDCAQEFS